MKLDFNGVAKNLTKEVLNIITEMTNTSLDRLCEMACFEQEGKCYTLPIKIGEILYTNVSMSGWYMREKNKPYRVKVVYIGINETGGHFNVVYDNDNMYQFNFTDIDDIIFYSYNEAKEKINV